MGMSCRHTLEWQARLTLHLCRELYIKHIYWWREEAATQIPSQDLNMKLLWLSIKHTQSKAVQRGRCQCRKIQKSEMWLDAWNFCHRLQTCTTYAIWFWNDDRIFLLGWTVSLRLEKRLKILENHLFLQMQNDTRTLGVSKWRCSHLTWLRSFSLSARDALHVMWRIYDLWCSLFLSAFTLHLHNCGNNCAWESTTHILFRKYSSV